MSFKALTDRLPIYLQELFIKCNNIQLLDETGQNIVIYQW